ncbi:hypothetical protein J3F84DRAFT_363731 [Trichoderma pleuroticola]
MEMTCVADGCLHSHYPSISLTSLISTAPISLHRLFLVSFCSFFLSCVFFTMDLIAIIFILGGIPTTIRLLRSITAHVTVPNCRSFYIETQQPKAVSTCIYIATEHQA